MSRGELVEIGGGVRIPEIVRRAGARLVEVGTTNRTRAADFEEPLADGRARLVLRVHPSNFTQSGFVEVPDAREVAGLAHRHGAIVVDDLGSGALLDTARFGLTHEPMPGERLAAGSDVVTFSGDKLVGGPQAGLVVGRADLVAKMRKDPLARAMRPDKATLAAVAATLGLYRAGRAESAIPVWRMIATPWTRSRAGRSARRALAGAGAPAAVEVRSTIGGGSLPGETLPSWGVALPVRSPDRVVAALRRGSPCVLARVEDGRVILDLRTVLEDPLIRLPGRSRRLWVGLANRDRGRWHGRPYRPRQDDAAPRAHRHRRRPPAGGAPTRDDDRRWVRAPRRCPMALSSTSSTSPATTGLSATCSWVPARSMRRCSSWLPMTASAPRPTSTSTCSTRWTSGTRSWPSRRPISWP